MSASTRAGGSARPWILLAILSLIWGSSFILMKEGLEGFSALELALIRISIAGLCLAPFAVRNLRKLQRGELALLFVVGLTGNALPAFLYAKSETVLPTAVVGVLTSLTPICALIVAWIFFRQRFPLANIAGIGIGLVGAAILAMAGNPEADRTTNLAFALLVLVATISYGINVNLIKQFFTKRDPVFITSIALLAVGLPSLAWLLAGTGFLQALHTNPAAPAALGYIAILGAFGTALSVLLFNGLLQSGSIIFATSVTYTIPIVAALWGIVLHEALTGMHALAFAIIFGGVWLANRRPSASVATARPRPGTEDAAA